MTEFPRHRVPAITPEQWEALGRYINHDRPLRTVTAEALAEAAGKDADVAVIEACTALMFDLYKIGAVSLWLSVWHPRCTDAGPVARRRFDEGFQPVPWTCPRCKRCVGHRDDLRYQFEADVLETVVFV